MLRIAILSLVAFSLAGTSLAKQGLIATYSDGTSTVVRVVPNPNFTLSKDESIHSQISPNFQAVYTGVLRIARGANYRLEADAKIVIGGEVANDKAIKLAAGDHPVQISYERKPGEARLQVRWESDFFVNEPIPSSAFQCDNESNAEVDAWKSIEEGRYLAEALNCAACHNANDLRLEKTKGPVLSEIGAKFNSQWIYEWLKTPKAYHSETTMPTVLNDDQQIRDVAAYLSTLGSANQQARSNVAVDTKGAVGSELFESIGCVKCHTKKSHTLSTVATKFSSVEKLAEFLIDPLHSRPSGRMPQLLEAKTQSQEAVQIAQYLFAASLKPKKSLKTDDADIKRGRSLIQSTGCLACHEVREPAQLTSAVSATAPALSSNLDLGSGCLATSPSSPAVDYSLTATQRANITDYLKSVTAQPVVAAAPTETFQRRVRQFNCTACHELDGKNAGPSKAITDDGRIVKIERPPTLTGVGNKLQVDWLHEVLLKKKRTRPWMQTRMPHFGEAMQQLPELILASSGSPRIDDTPKPKMDLAHAGLEIIGVRRGQVACINCHNYRNINQQKEGVVPAPDMAEIGRTLRFDWFQRWMANPSRMQPGTSMPQFFLEAGTKGRDEKIKQLWAALMYQDKLDLPKGLVDQQTEGTQITVGDDPVIFRVATKLKEGVRIDRAINVGLPGGKNFVFDAKTAQLRGVWTGDFINAGPAWNGRGGNPVTIIPKSLHVMPGQIRLRIGNIDKPPTVRFRGFDLVQKHPVFRYTIDDVLVRERIDLTDTELLRHFTVEAGGKTVFFVNRSKDEELEASAGAEFGEPAVKVSGLDSAEFKVRQTLPLEAFEFQSKLKWRPTKAVSDAPKSQNGSAISIIFQNKSKDTVKLIWIGYDGTAHEYGQINPNDTRRQSTYSNNTWLITAADGKPLGHFIATKESVSVAVIPK